MCLYEDSQTEAKLREDLYYGDNEGAKERLRLIQNAKLKEELRRVIREYEGAPDELA